MFVHPASRSSDDESPDLHETPVTNDELLAGVIRQRQELSLLQLANAADLAELEARGVCDRQKGSKTASYVAGLARADAGRVAGDLKVGRALRHFPDLVAAVADGRLSYDHLRQVAVAANPRILAGLVGLQAEIIELAAAGFRRFTHELRGLCELLDQDGGHDPSRDEQRNQLTVTPTFDGLLHLAGTLFGDDALAALNALNDRADELFLARRKDAEVTPDLAPPTRAQLLAQAFVDLCLAGRAVDRKTSKPPRAEVTLVVNADDPTASYDLHGVRLQDGCTRRLRCDPTLYPVVVDALGVPLDLGREVRLATDAQRRGIAVRDGGCVFPHCECEATWTEVHHVHPWEHGGPTDLAVMAALCRYHHGVSHRRDWQMHVTPDGWFWWRSPNGDTFWSQRHGKQRAGPTPTC